MLANCSFHPHHSQHSMAQRSLGLSSEIQFHPLSPTAFPLGDTGSWKSQWCSGEPGSLVHCNQVQELVVQFVYSNVNISSFLQNKATGLSWPHVYGSALKLAAIPCQTCRCKKTHRENDLMQTRTESCPVPSQISRMLFSTTPCASPQQSPVMCYKTPASDKAPRDLAKGMQTQAKIGRWPTWRASSAERYQPSFSSLGITPTQ